MNKYFLSLMSILILFQSFKVSDEIFNHKKDVKKGYIILELMKKTESVAEGKTDVQEIVDFDSLLANANLDGGKNSKTVCRLS